MYFSNGRLTLADKKDIAKLRIAERIKIFRKKRNVTQENLGKRIGLSKSMISKYERANLSIPSEMLPLIADELNISAEFLFCEDTKEPYGYNIMEKCLYQLLQQETSSETKFMYVQQSIHNMEDMAIQRIGCARLFDFMYMALMFAAKGHTDLHSFNTTLEIVNDIESEKSIMLNRAKQYADIPKWEL